MTRPKPTLSSPPPAARPWCSVVIPTLNEEACLPATLHRLAGADVELIVADGGSTDRTVRIARDHGARVVVSPAGRADQLNAGARVARGRSLLFLHADTLLPPDFSAYLRAAGADLPACFRLRFGGDHRSPLLSFYGYCTRFDVPAFRFGDQGLWVTREDFDAVGGYPAGYRLLEDNAMVRRLRRHRGGFRVLPVAVATSPRKYLKHGTAYTQLVYAVLYVLFRLGAGQGRLVRLYRRLLQ